MNEHASERSAKGVASAPLAADVGVVAALSIEVGHFLDRLANVRKYAGPEHTIIEGELDGKIVAVIVGGMGRIAARQAADLLIAGHRPRWIVSAGFGGALDPHLRRFDLIMPNVIEDLDGHRFHVDVSIPDDHDHREGSRLLTGSLVTIDSIAATAVEKSMLRHKIGATIVDMETSAVAAVCTERGLKFLAIRVVSDTASEDLPPEVVKLMTRSGGYLVGSALRSIWNRPSSLKDFWNLHQSAQEAADKLAEMLVSAIARLD